MARKRRVRPDVAWQRVDGEAVIIDVATGNTIALNPTGSFIWSLIDTRNEEEIAAEVAARFSVPLSDATSDVAAFLDLLEQRQLVAPA